jgi:glycosyltransferase involved in cell wall biosynthesis
MPETLSIIIPVYNEENTVSRILDRVLEVKLIGNLKKEIILVNDCSTDNTVGVLDAYFSDHPKVDMVLISQDVNRGKGAALHLGIAKASGEYLIIQDADLEYDPQDYNALLDPMLNDHADVVYGSRFMGGKPHRILFFWHTIGNRVLTLLSNMFNDLNLTDMETCYKLFRTDMIKRLELRENRFGFEPEVTAKISRIDNIRLYEVGIAYYGRTYAEGKKINWKDGFQAIWCIFRYGIFK